MREKPAEVGVQGAVLCSVTAAGGEEEVGWGRWKKPGLCGDRMLLQGFDQEGGVIWFTFAKPSLASCL